MVNFDQGPGRNIQFCLITTGLNIDPDHGCFNREVYQWLKNVILQRAEIHFENPTIREVFDIDSSGFLGAYDPSLRTIYQFLFGLVNHSNGWTEETLTDAIDTTPFPRKLDPEDGEYSIDFVQSIKDGLTLFQNQLVITTNVWIEEQTFYYSSCKPLLLDGVDGDVWLVSDGLDVELWIKRAFNWIRLNDYVKTLDPQGTVTYSTTDPGNSTNSWWLDLTGLNIRRYSVALNSWESFTSVIVSPTSPGGLSDGDLWLRIDTSGKFFLSVFNGTTFNAVKFSLSPVQDRVTNSAFVGTSGNNNFVINCPPEDALFALGGGPLAGVSDLKVKKDNVLIQAAVNCINFLGPDLEVTASGLGVVDVEHLPFTCLPEQVSAPTAVPEAGKVFTLDIGGITELFYIDDSGTLIQLTNNGITIQNVFFAVSTSSASADQTVFSVPTTAISILAFKINGVDTTAFTFSSPSVTYLPGAGGYNIQDGDVVTILFYG